MAKIKPQKNKQESIRFIEQKHRFDSKQLEKQYKLDIEERDEKNIQDVNEDINWLFQNGFLQRNTSYMSARGNIEKRTMLTFKPFLFVQAMNMSLKAARKNCLAEEAHEKLTSGSTYICMSQNCSTRCLSADQQNSISAQLTKITLDQISCPNCHQLGTLKKPEQINTPEYKNRKLTRKMITELYFQSVYLLRQVPGIDDEEGTQRKVKYALADIAIGQEQSKDSLERELRAMRAQHNKKINFYRKETEQQIIWPNRSHIFLNNQSGADKATDDTDLAPEQRHAQQLVDFSKGMNPNSVINTLGPVYKAPRFYQAGAGTGGRPEWLTRVFLKANKVLYGD